MSGLELIVWGCIGGALPDILRILAARHRKMPIYLRHAFYWTSLTVLAGIGGLAAYLIQPNKPIQALAMGYSAPSIFSTALGGSIRVDQARRKDQQPNDLNLEYSSTSRFVRATTRLLSDILTWWGK
jgi:hypothetical protein